VGHGCAPLKGKTLIARSLICLLLVYLAISKNFTKTLPDVKSPAFAMARRFYKLPSLTGLNTFDACARHGSLTQAAKELGVTLGAVSRQIKSLETELESSLFKRHHRGVELTVDGLELYRVLSNSFRNIGELCQSLKNRGKSSDVAIAATTAFASLWLMPRLGNFWSEHPEITLNHSISDNPTDPGFLSADIRIRYGDGKWNGEIASKLFDDVIYPVAGVQFGQQHKLSFAQDLTAMPLLQLDNLDPAWTGWERWLGEWDVKLGNAAFRRFNNYVVALQAAQENHGVVLGWHSQVEPLISQGKLVRLGNLEIQAPGSFYLTWDVDRPLSVQADTLRQWLLEVSV
jgi:LysR family glycine cleavage system transcriptional activator